MESGMLVITLGDPLSISQQCLVSLASSWAQPSPGPVVFVGSLVQWTHQSARFGWPTFTWRVVRAWQEIRGPGLYFFDIDPDGRTLAPESLSAEARGRIAVAALLALKDLSLEAGPLAVVTAPIDKKACHMAGFRFPGQTEYFESLWGRAGIMILAGPRLRVALATNHLALAEVTPAIHEDLILRKTRLFHHALQSIFGVQSPRIGVAALNPHAGDGGLFGDEDSRLLAPAVQKLKQEGLDVTGPLPADTVFFRAYEGAFDGVLAMYHDQGLGPLKTVHFYDAVNVTGGLPALRISPDHGPAAELFGRGQARADSFQLALEHARRYLRW
jgi:4-hydroxythreonine-4-phosphate dehydrogenase